MEGESGWGRAAGRICEGPSGSAREGDILPLGDGLEVLAGEEVLQDAGEDDDEVEEEEVVDMTEKEWRAPY